MITEFKNEQQIKIVFKPYGCMFFLHMRTCFVFIKNNMPLDDLKSLLQKARKL